MRSFLGLLELKEEKKIISKLFFSLSVHTKSRGVMVTPKKCKFLQLCEHHFGVSSTMKRCSFTPTWCKFVFMSCN